jgi:hypothetical protein
MDVITSIINGIGNVPAEAWASIFAIVGVSAFQQKIKNWLVLENPKVLVFMTGVFSLAGAVVPAVLGWMSAQPADLVSHSALWFTGMTLAYRYVIQPGQKSLDSWKTDVAKYKAYKSNKAAAASEALAAQPEPDYLDELAKDLPAEQPALPAGVTPEFEG